MGGDLDHARSPRKVLHNDNISSGVFAEIAIFIIVPSGLVSSIALPGERLKGDDGWGLFNFNSINEAGVGGRSDGGGLITPICFLRSTTLKQRFLQTVLIG